MALQDQVIPINLGQGIDTKTDSKLVVAGKLLRLENGVFTKAKQISKRNGYIEITTAILGGGNITDPKLVKTYQDELVCADQGHLYSYSPSLACWQDKGSYVSLETSLQPVSSSQLSETFQSFAVAGSLALYAWSQKATSGATAQSTYITIQDLDSKALLISDNLWNTPGSANFDCPKTCAIAGTSLAAFYLNGSNQLEATIFSLSSSGLTSIPVTVGSDVVGYSVTGGRQAQYDVAQTTTGCVVAYSKSTTFTGTPTDIVIKTLDTSGSVTHTATLSAVGPASPLSVSVDPTNGNVWVFWVDNTTPSSGILYYAVFNSTLSVVRVKTTIFSGAQNLSQIAPLNRSTTSYQIYYTTTPSGGTATTEYRTVTSAGSVGSPTVMTYHLEVFSKPFSVDSKAYLLAQYRSSVQNVLFVLGLDTTVAGTVIAKALSGISNATALPQGYVSQPQLVSGSQYGVLSAYALTTDTVQGASSQLLGSTLCLFDFASSEAYQAMEANKTLVLNGGIGWLYDGASCAELGFHLAPEITSATQGAAGNMADGTYQYYVVFQWTDSQGNFHQSAPSIAQSIAVTGGGGTAKVTLALKLPVITSKRSGVAISYAVYRTKANQTLPILVSAPIPVNGTTPTASFVDTYSDTTISGSNALYTTGGVLENDPPPPFVAMTLHNNRVQVIDSENKNVWYSKSLIPGVGISFSGDLLQQVLDTCGEPVGLASMDEKLVVLGSKQPVVIVGDGANDAGLGSSLSSGQPIPADTGCTTSKGIITYPGGVLFKSPKGIYLLDRGLNVKYLGLEVEDYNGQSLVSSVLDFERSQLRLLTDSGLCLVYDYLFNQWSTFTNHEGVSATIWQGAYVYARTDGKLYQESSGYYLDGTTAFKLLIRTSWLAIASVQGFQRVRRFATLGSYANGASSSHGIQVSAAYDFSETFSTPIPFTFGSASTSGALQYRERLPIQKCDAISLLIEEITTGDSAEYLDLSDMSFEAGVKRGINKLSSNRSVG
jgi:hypothetical protein